MRAYEERQLLHAHCIHLRLLHRTLQGHSLALIALDRLSMDENPHHLLQLLLATRLVPRGPTQAAARRGALHASFSVSVSQ